MNKKIILFASIILLLFGIKVLADNNEEILILFDASLSMAEDISGTTKYTLAADAAKNKLREIGNDKKTGLRTIGITLDGNMINYITDPASMCKATKLAVPVGINNSAYIENILDTGMPLGVTPLMYALKTSIENDFSQSSYKHIILITDGGESCDEDPCGYISKIMQARKDIKIDVIAIGVESSDFGQLQCLSDATGGKIYNIKSKNEITQAFNNILPVRAPASVPVQVREETMPPPVIQDRLPANNYHNNNCYEENKKPIYSDFKIFKREQPPVYEKSGIIYKNYTIEVND